MYVDWQSNVDPKKSDLLQGTLDLLILRTLAAQGPLHGYGIAQRILVLSRETIDVQQGSLYPALHRLDRKSLVQSEWKESPESGKMAKFYTLTPEGRKHLASELDQWARYTASIGWVLEG